MKLLILTQYFPPEIGGAQTRLYCVAKELRRMGHEVEVVTAMPNYPSGRIFSSYMGQFYRREVMDGIVIRRVWLFAATGTGVRRMLNYASFTLTSLFGLLQAARPDYMFVESPPLFLSIPAWMLATVWRVPLIFNVADLWPDVAVDAGHIRDGLLCKAMRMIERWSYRRATYVNAVTLGIRDTLLQKKNVPLEKLLFLPNGADTNHYHPQPPDKNLAARLGLTGKKVILWAGTLGPAHGLHHVLRAAQLLEDHQEIHFLFVGHGSERPVLEALRDRMDLRNVTFRDPVAIQDLPPYYSIAVAGLSSLTNIPLHDVSRPSKIFPVLASGKPMIFSGFGETARLIREANAGVVVPPDNSSALANGILQLVQNPVLAEEMGRNARQFVEANFQWSQLIAKWVTQLVKQSREASLVSSPTRT